MSASETNKAAVRDCFANASQGNFDALHDILSPDYVLHPAEIRGVDGLTEMVKQYRSALSGLTVNVEHQFTEGDWVATRYTITGKHTGDLMGVAATGTNVAFSGLTVSRCIDGQIVEEWEITDALALMGQVGALPQMAQG